MTFFSYTLKTDAAKQIFTTINPLGCVTQMDGRIKNYQFTNIYSTLDTDEQDTGVSFYPWSFDATRPLNVTYENITFENMYSYTTLFAPFSV